MTTFLEPPTRTQAGSRSAATPRGTARDTSIDVARAWCLMVAVALHALMVGVSVVAGTPVLENAMDSYSGFAALTWVMQIMPLFFVLGGFSSATQWSRLREKGVPAHEYIAMRLGRLLGPALGAMAVTAAVLVGLVLAGVSDEVVAVAGFRLSQPLWFLGVYLLLTGLVPFMMMLHRTAPRATVAGLGALVVGVDLTRIGTGIEAVGFANLLFVWLLMQQLGFFLAEGRPNLDRRGHAVGAVAALGTLTILCTFGVYDWDLYENLNPPTAALVLFGLAQICLFQLARPILRRAHELRAVQRIVGAINARSMTIYSWHMLVLIGMAGVLMFTVGEALPTPVSDEWWATRPAWFAAATLITVLLVALVGRREARGGARIAARESSRKRTTTALLLAAGGVLLVLVVGASPLAWVGGAVLVAAGLAIANGLGARRLDAARVGAGGVRAAGFRAARIRAAR
ncbi:acyltransferase [Protaetiibacter sp. SSC-01]|uniref:acyltransferase family protein n=1 Tax=Protaetiibacter sp. SSC-01 TaxID=2759943 RepID=UPI00223B6249|nr:acyltransferase [Protaetiibacter sp. SSC-01]